MKRLRRPVVFLLGVWLLAMLSSACQPAVSLSSPRFLRFEPNAYDGIEQYSGQIELDNPLVWRFEAYPEKYVQYYAFRVIVGADKPAEYRFFWLRQADTGQGVSIPRVDGPCPAESAEPMEPFEPSELSLMQLQSKTFTGNPNGPAIYSAEVAWMLHGARAVYWETCELPDLPQGDDKDPYQKRFTFLVNTNDVPGTLQAQLCQRLVKGEELRLPSQLAGMVLVHSPFHMAAIGDSLMWGQGLAEGDKIWSQVRHAIEETGQVVRAHNFAFSGAWLDRNGNGYDDCAIVDLVPTPVPEEVPHSRPDIRCQFERIAGYGEGVVPGNPLPLERLDLLLMDGCANDIDASEIVLGTGDAADEDTLRHAIQCHCGGIGEDYDCGEYEYPWGPDRGYGTGQLVQAIRARAPNAQIVLLGYFPFLSMGSVGACPAQEGIGGAAALVSLLTGMGGAAFTAAYLEGGLVAWLYGAEVRSQQWVSDTDQVFADSVEKANRDQLGIGVGSASFVPIPSFHGHEAFVVSEAPWLWGLECFLEPEDPIRGDRRLSCELEHQRQQAAHANDPNWRDDPARWLACDRASAFHPNVAGEMEYTRLVIDRLRVLGVLRQP
jgi:hypothetical protein